MTHRYLVEQDPPLSRDFLEYLCFLVEVPDDEYYINLPVDQLLISIKDESVKKKFKDDYAYLIGLAKEQVNYIEFAFKKDPLPPVVYDPNEF